MSLVHPIDKDLKLQPAAQATKWLIFVTEKFTSNVFAGKRVPMIAWVRELGHQSLEHWTPKKLLWVGVFRLHANIIFQKKYLSIEYA